jgi:hypothetical protein
MGESMKIKYVQKRGLERVELKNYPTDIKQKIKDLLNGKSVALSEEELIDNSLSQFLKEEIKKEKNNPKKGGVKDGTK